METATDVEKKQIGSVRTDFWYIGKTWVNVFYTDDAEINTHRPPILMIHGMFGGGWYFEPWAQFFCEKGFVVYVVNDLHEGEDMRKVDFYTYLEKTTKVAEEICATRRSKIMLVGHSMGGLIAQKIAETKPDLIAGLVLVASAPPKGIKTMSWGVAKAMAKHLIPLICNMPLKIDKKSVLQLILNWLGDEERKEQIFEKFVPESSKAAKQLAFSRIQVDAKKVVCKILVVAGLYDRLLSYKTQIRIANKYNRANMNTVATYDFCLTGHMPMLERSSEKTIDSIYHWIKDFLI